MCLMVQTFQLPLIFTSTHHTFCTFERQSSLGFILSMMEGVKVYMCGDAMETFGGGGGGNYLWLTHGEA